MLFFRRRHAGARNVALTLPPPDEMRISLFLPTPFLRAYASHQGKKAETFHPSLVRSMAQRVWPGNVREFGNFVERIVTLATSDITELDQSLLPEECKAEFRSSPPAKTTPAARRSLRESVHEVERQILLETLTAHCWNQSEAARALQISERTMRYKMSLLGLDKGAKTDDKKMPFDISCRP